MEFEIHDAGQAQPPTLNLNTTPSQGRNIHETQKPDPTKPLHSPARSTSSCHSIRFHPTFTSYLATPTASRLRHLHLSPQLSLPQYFYQATDIIERLNILFFFFFPKHRKLYGYSSTIPGRRRRHRACLEVGHQTRHRHHPTSWTP